MTIDGPAGSGKTTVAKRLAQRLGFRYLDTGAMYRAVALRALRSPRPITTEADWDRLVADLRLEFDADRVFLDGEDVTQEIRRPEVTEATRACSQSAAVRRRLGQWQRAYGRSGRLVAEGRDMGTVVFPDADRKFFLTATAEERARRRQQELATAGCPCSLEEVLAAQNERDRQDSERALAPLAPAPDATIVDTTGKTIGEVVEWLFRLVQEADKPCRAPRG